MLVRSVLLMCIALCQVATVRTALAQEDLAVPPQEDREAWREAWREVSQSDDATEAIPRLAIEVEDGAWSLVVWDSRGDPRRVGIQPPQSQADRVDLLFLAISLARSRDDWGWSAIEEATPDTATPVQPEPTTEAAPVVAAEPLAQPTRPIRSFISAGPSPASVSAPLSPSTEAAPPEPPLIVRPGPDPLDPTPSTSAPTPGEPEPEPLDPIFPELRDPIPILDDPNQQGPWPAWAWIQLGGGPTWRPQTSLAWEGAMRAGWIGRDLRIGLGIRASTPSALLAFHNQAARSAWDLDLLVGPWIPLGSHLVAGIEGGLAMRRYRQQGQLIATDTLPTAALELQARLQLPGFELGPYLRGEVDLDSTRLDNGTADPDPVELELWNISTGLQLARVASSSRRGSSR